MVSFENIITPFSNKNVYYFIILYLNKREWKFFIFVKTILKKQFSIALIFVINFQNIGEIISLINKYITAESYYMHHETFLLYYDNNIIGNNYDNYYQL